MKKLFIASLFFFTTTYSFSQATIAGEVLDLTNANKLPFAEIILKQGNSPVETAVSNENGTYSIEGIEEGQYTLEVDYLGFEPFSIELNFQRDETKDLNLLLRPSSETLNEVVVTVKKTTIDFLPDKMVVNVGEDLLAAGADSAELLRQLPSVDVDASGNVSLRNDPNVVVMIDGKRSQLSSSEIIAQIPANDIQQIEVITNPSAKYDAEGVSGILNIITKRGRSFGANLQLQAGIGEYEKSDFGFNGNYGTEKTNSYLSYNLSNPYNEMGSTLERQAQGEEIEQKGKLVMRNAVVHSLKGGVDFFIDSTQTISPSGSFQIYKHDPLDRSITEVDPVAGEPYSFEYIYSNGHEHKIGAGNINYRKEFKGNSHFLEADLNIATYDNVFDLDIWRGDEVEDQFVITDDQELSSHIATASTDYYLNRKSRVWELGFKYENRDITNSQDREVIREEDISTFNNDFEYRDGIWAAYGVLEQKLGKLTLKGGLRLEYTQRDMGDFESEESTDDYLNLFPSLSASYPVGKLNLSTSYSRRISRPSVFHLNPFTMEQPNLTRLSGNPFLDPSFADKVELKLNTRIGKTSMNLAGFFGQTTDQIQQIFTGEEDGYILSTFANVGKSQDYGVEFFMRNSWVSWWQNTITANYYFSEFETDIYNSDVSFFQTYAFNNNFTFLKTWRAQLNVGYYPKAEGLQQVREGYSRVDMAISKSLFKNKGLLTLRASDVFDTHEMEILQTLPGVEQKWTHKPLTRFLYLSYRHSFKFGTKDVKNRDRMAREYEQGNVG